MPDVSMATKYRLVSQYYQGTTVWDKVLVEGLSYEQLNAMYNSLPGSYYTFDRTPDGTRIGLSYDNPFELPVVPGTDFDSNIDSGSYGSGNTFSGNVPTTLVTDPDTGLPVRQAAGTYNPSTGSMLTTVADKVSLAVAGVNIGAKLGMSISSALYESDPAFWDTHLPTMNPETWDSLVGVNPVGDFFLRTLFGITGDSATAYLSEDALAYYYQMMRDEGFFDVGDYYAEPAQGTGLPYPFTGNIKLVGGNVKIAQPPYYTLYDKGDAEFIILAAQGNNLNFTAISRSPFTCYQRSCDANWNPYYSDTKGSYSYTSPVTGTVYYYRHMNTTYMPSIANLDEVAPLTNLVTSGGYVDEHMTVFVYEGTIHQTPGHEGVNQMPDATYYPPTAITGTTPQQVLQQLKQEYPDLFEDAIVETTAQEDGSVKEITYIPIPWVTPQTTGEEVTTEEEKTQTDYYIDPEIGQEILPSTPQDETTTPPDTGEGDTPVPVIPTGSASSLWAIYNPTQAQVDAFGAWLWSSNFVEQLKKLFNDPMQAIIGIHKVFATPSTGAAQTIKCGYLDSGVSSAIVTSQYTSVDCGSANLREYFGNVFDYDPYTRVSLFLPFIGIVPLNVSEVMRSTVSVKYKVDVLTGACLAEVSIKRDNSGGILYTYSGSAIVSYPVSSGSYVGVVQAALSTALGVGSAIATGGASLGVSAAMVMGGISRAKTQVQHSGQFSGAAGAMGGKKPYLIIVRPQTRTPEKINEYAGYPSNAIHKLSACTGYTRVREVHVASVSAYDNELAEIETLLKTGVII